MSNKKPANRSRRVPLGTTLIALALLVLGYVITGQIPDDLRQAFLGEPTTGAQQVGQLTETPATSARAAKTAPVVNPETADTPVPESQAEVGAQTTPPSTPTTVRQATRGPTVTPVRSQSGLPVIFYDELPPEAKETIRLIEQDGPFPYRKDGATFSNREGLLPARPHGYYREYTVITPGSPDRGARRIVAGENGELYYTDDHYASFREVVR